MRPLLISLLASSLLLAGCANPLSRRSEQEVRVERRPLAHSLSIGLNGPERLEQARRLIRVTEQRTLEVTDIEVNRLYDRYTPYQAWREFYELPLGILYLGGGLGANLLNLLSLGQMPEHATHNWLRNGLDGVNPAMNIQSNGRAQQNLARLEEVRRESRLEHSSLPWADKPVSLVAGTRSYDVFTGTRGAFTLDLLDEPLLDEDFSSISRLLIQVRDPQDDTRAEAVLQPDRVLRGRLHEARALLQADLEGSGPQQWAWRICRLEALGFDEQARQLQQNLVELARQDPQLQQEFRQALAQARKKPARPSRRH